MRFLIFALYLITFSSVQSFAKTFEQEVAEIYKKNKGKEKLYNRYYLLNSLLSDTSSKDLIKRLEVNSLKIKNNKEAYYLYKIGSINKLIQNGNIKEAFKLSENLQWDKGLRNKEYLLPYLYNTIASIYTNISKEYVLAEKYLKLSKKIQFKLKDTVGYQSCCINIAQVCFHAGKFKEGKKQLSIAKELEKKGFTKFHQYIVIAEMFIYLGQNKYQESYDFIEKNKEAFMSTGPSQYYSNIGIALFNLKRYNEAEKNLLIAEEMCKKDNNYSFCLTISSCLSLLYEETKNLDLAFSYKKKTDSLKELATSNNVKYTLDSLKLVNARKEIEIETKHSRDLLHKSKFKQKILIIGLIVLLAFVISLVYFLYRVRMKNIELVKTAMNTNIIFEDDLNNDYKKEINLQKELNIQLASELNDFLIEKKNFVKKEISLQYLAKKFKSNQHDISETINLYYGNSLPNLLNKLRIQEALKILSDEKFMHYSIEGVSREVGYESISTFNRNFKEITGVTPSFYLKESKKILNSSRDFPINSIATN